MPGCGIDQAAGIVDLKTREDMCEKGFVILTQVLAMSQPLVKMSRCEADLNRALGVGVAMRVDNSKGVCEAVGETLWQSQEKTMAIADLGAEAAGASFCAGKDCAVFSDLKGHDSSGVFAMDDPA